MDQKMNKIKTEDMYNNIINCEEIDELKEILDLYSPYYAKWRDYINDVLLTNGYTYENISELCGFSKNTVKAWATENRIPRSREKFIQFGLGLRCDLDEMNYILQRYGKYPRLYSKSLEDAICMFVISHYPEDRSINAYDVYNDLRKKFLEEIQIKNKRRFLIDSQNTTSKMEKKIVTMKGIDEFEKFVKEYEVEFMNSYYKLLDYITAFVKTENVGKSYHSLVLGNEMDKGYEKMLSNLRNWGEVPNRRKLINLGITLNMSLVEINNMLHYANMEKLCSKDKLECIILFVLANIDVISPYHEINHAVLVAQYTENQEIKKQCNNLLEELIGLKNADQVREDVEFYVKDALESLEIDEKDVFMDI